MKCSIEAKVNLSIIEDLLADRMWAGVSSHEANAGLEQGGPNLTVAKRLVTQLSAAGKTDESQGAGKHRAPRLLGRCTR